MLLDKKRLLILISILICIVLYIIFFNYLKIDKLKLEIYPKHYLSEAYILPYGQFRGYSLDADSNRTNYKFEVRIVGQAEKFYTLELEKELFYNNLKYKSSLEYKIDKNNFYILTLFNIKIKSNISKMNINFDLYEDSKNRQIIILNSINESIYQRGVIGYIAL